MCRLRAPGARQQIQDQLNTRHEAQLRTLHCRPTNTKHLILQMRSCVFACVCVGVYSVRTENCSPEGTTRAASDERPVPPFGSQVPFRALFANLRKNIYSQTSHKRRKVKSSGVSSQKSGYQMLLSRYFFILCHFT